MSRMTIENLSKVGDGKRPITTKPAIMITNPNRNQNCAVHKFCNSYWMSNYDFSPVYGIEHLTEDVNHLLIRVDRLHNRWNQMSVDRQHNKWNLSTDDDLL